MGTQLSNSHGPHNATQALVGLGAVVLFAAVLDQVAALLRHLLNCLAGQLFQVLPWVALQACHSIQADLPNLGHLLTCYHVLASTATLLFCMVGTT